MERADDENVEAVLQQFKAQDMEMIKEKEWKFASASVPIEVHIELIKLTYEAKLWEQFDELLDPALVRLKFRRYEVPYLATIDVQMSSTKVSNIPNGFEKLPQDLNSANLKIELKKLRASAKLAGAGDDADEAPAAKKDAGKAQAPPAKKEEPPKKGAPAKGGKEDPKKAAAGAAAGQAEPPAEEEDEIMAS